VHGVHAQPLVCQAGNISREGTGPAAVAHDRVRLHDQRMPGGQQAQPQVPVRDPSQRRVQAAGGEHRLAAQESARDAQRVALVHERQQRGRGMESRGRLVPQLAGRPPVEADDVRVTEAGGRVRVSLHAGELRSVLAGLPRVVVVAQRDELGGQLSQPRRARRRQAATLRMAHDVAVRRVLIEQHQRLGRAVVDDDDLVRARILAQDRVERLGEQRCPPVDWDDDAGAHGSIVQCAVLPVHPRSGRLPTPRRRHDGRRRAGLIDLAQERLVQTG